MIKQKQIALNKLNNRIKGCSNCRLSLTRRNIICGEGNPDARLMLIAMSPGEHEDRECKMFIGPSGKILDKLLDIAVISRDSIYMTNLVKCKLPKNRKPKQDEIEACSHFLDKEIAILSAKIIVPLGYYATRYILKKYAYNYPSARANYHALYGKLILVNEQKIFPLPHPASLLYNPSYTEATAIQYHKLQSLSQD